MSGRSPTRTGAPGVEARTSRNQNQIVMEDTLDAAIDCLFGKPGSAGPASAADRRRGRAAASVRGRADRASRAAGRPIRKALAAEALAHYERALAAQRDGNWARLRRRIKSSRD